MMNTCMLEGHISGEPEERLLPSGDAIVVFRLVVPRPNASRVDTIDCVATSPSLRKRTLSLADGTVVSVEGSLHRRFFRAAGGVASRYEVSITRLQRVRVGAT